MHRRSGFVSALVLSGALMFGCGSDGTSFATVEQALQECSQSSMTSMIRTLLAIVTVPDVIAGESPLPGFDVDFSMTAVNTYSFSVVFDTNSNGVNDSAIVGTMTFSEDPTDGIDPGATIQIAFTLQNSPVLSGAVENGTVTGTGDIVATAGPLPEQATISGTVSFADSAGRGCTADLTFPVSAPLVLDFSGGGLPKPVQLAAYGGFFETFGTIQAIIESLGHTLDATITLVDGDQTVNVVGDIDGTAVDFDFELLPSDAILSQLFDCAFFGFEWSFFFAETYQDVIAVVLGGKAPGGIVVTPTANPNVFAYTLDLAVIDPATFSTGTVTGQATLGFTAATQLSGASPSSIAFTWTITNASFLSGDVVSGQNAAGRPFRMFIDGLGALLAYEGAGSITITPAAPVLTGVPLPPPCVVDFDILPGDPILADESDGTAIITVTIGSDVMVLIADFDAQEGVVTINGIPFFSPL